MLLIAPTASGWDIFRTTGCFLKARINRLSNLYELGAPVVVLHNETNLISQRLDKLLAQEGASPGPDPSQQLIDRCMKLLEDVPGDSLDQRVSRLILWYASMTAMYREKADADGS